MSQSEDKFLIISVPKTKHNKKAKHYVVVTKKEKDGTAFVIGNTAFHAEVRSISTNYEDAEQIVNNLIV